MPRKSGRKQQKQKQARRRVSAAQKRSHTLAAKAMRLHHSKRISLKAAWRQVRKSNHYYDGQDDRRKIPVRLNRASQLREERGERAVANRTAETKRKQKKKGRQVREQVFVPLRDDEDMWEDRAHGNSQGGVMRNMDLSPDCRGRTKEQCKAPSCSWVDDVGCGELDEEGEAMFSASEDATYNNWAR